MKHNLTAMTCAGATALGLALTSASAENTQFALGDLVLYFQKPGSSNTVYADLGNAATAFRGAAAGSSDGVNRVNFLDLNATLTSAFGSSWANDPSIFAGLAGVWGTSSLNKTTLQDGDPHRTLYVSKSRDGVGTVGSPNSVAWNLSNTSSTLITAAAQGIDSQNSVLEFSYTTAVAISPTTISQIDEQNPFLTPTIQAAPFGGAFEGGVQQAGSSSSFGVFGDAGNVEFALDLYRILAVNTAPGQVAGDLLVGSYEGTVTLNSLGQVSFIAHGAVISKPEIDIQQPFGSSLVDGTSKKSFGTVVVGQSSAAKTFTIKNTGTAALTGLAITKTGAQSAQFTVSALTKTSLAAGGKTTFNVTFKPTTSGSHYAAIHIKSNDANENPFDISLSGLAP